jgi:hypothetical protein
LLSYKQGLSYDSPLPLYPTAKLLNRIGKLHYDLDVAFTVVFECFDLLLQANFTGIDAELITLGSSSVGGGL